MAERRHSAIAVLSRGKTWAPSAKSPPGSGADRLGSARIRSASSLYPSIWRSSENNCNLSLSGPLFNRRRREMPTTATPTGRPPARRDPSRRKRDKSNRQIATPNGLQGGRRQLRLVPQIIRRQIRYFETVCQLARRHISIGSPANFGPGRKWRNLCPLPLKRRRFRILKKAALAAAALARSGDN